MNTAISIFVLALLFYFTGYCSCYTYKYEHDPVVVYRSEENKNSPAYCMLIDALNNFGVTFKETGTIADKNRLHVLLDIETVCEDQMPNDYIAFVSKNYKETPFTFSTSIKLNRSVVIWDYTTVFTNLYSSSSPNYLDPWESVEEAGRAILVLLLPRRGMQTYRDLMRYGAVYETEYVADIFAHGAINRSRKIVQLGVGEGRHAKALSEIAKLNHGRVLGIDVNGRSENSYAQLHDPTMDFIESEYSEYRNRLKDKSVDLLCFDSSVYDDSLSQLINAYLSVVAEHGMICFCDVKCCSGALRSIQDCFVRFDQARYEHKVFTKDGSKYELLHYPKGNALTIIRKV